MKIKLIRIWNKLKRWFMSNILKKEVMFTINDWTGEVSIEYDGSETKMTWTRGNNAMPVGVRNRAFVFCGPQSGDAPDGYCKFLYTIVVPEGWKNSGETFTIEKHIKHL